MIICQQTRGLLSSNDQLALDLPLAETKSIAARVGPNPVFTRASSATYFGPKIEVFGYVLDFDGFVVGRARWYTIFDPINSYSIAVYYDGTQWLLEYAQQEVSYFFAAAGNEWRPDQADWSASGINVTTSSTFGIIGAANNEPRFEHNPLTGVCNGLLLEQSRTNLVFPSDTLTTQTRTVTAVAHTLSFYGTGTVVLSGTHSATVVGTGAFPTRRIFNFTPTAGSLTLTVTGTVQFAQLEVSPTATATSYIPTTTGSAIRSQDLYTITGANFLGMYNQSEGTVFCAAIAVGATSAASGVYGITAATRSNGGIGSDFAAAILRVAVHAAPSFTSQATFVSSAARNVLVKSAIAVRTDDFAGSINGSIATDTSGTLVTIMDRFVIGATGNTAGPQVGNNIFSSIRYYRKRLPNAKLQALTAP